jgi:hypothetical protein
MAIVTVLSALMCFFASQVFPQHPFFEAKHVSRSNYMGFAHNETCAYIGRSGHHLHWTSAYADTHMSPNTFAYVLLWIPLVFARPLRFCALPFLLMLGVFGFQLYALNGSYEAGSIWCWSALNVHIYFLVQPHIWPIIVEELESNGKKVLKTATWEI